jgi:hypothetical protein
MTTRTRNNGQPPTVIFLHLPKAAGTTLYQVINRQYPPAAILTSEHPWPNWIGKFSQVPDAHKAQYKIIRGHVRFGLHEYLPQPATYFTVVRHPVDRIISFYYFVRQSPDHYLYEAVTTQQMSLADLIHNQISTELDNGQTRNVSGIGHTIGFGECSPEILASAKQHLRERFSVVGLTDRFDETLLLLKRAFGWRMPLYVRVNITRNRPRQEEVSPETLELVRKHNALDMELYLYAQQLFEEQISQQGALFHKELQLFRMLNRLYGRIYTLSRSARRTAKTLLAK